MLCIGAERSDQWGALGTRNHFLYWARSAHRGPAESHDFFRAFLDLRLEPQSNSRIGGNNRTDSSIPSPHFLYLDNSCSFLRLLSSGAGLIGGPVCTKQSEPGALLCPPQQNHLVSDTASVLPSRRATVSFSCLMSPPCLYPSLPSPKCSEASTEWP